MSTDDDSFHPLGEEWENDLEHMLDDTEYDTDLGMQMAEDAMRVTKGELSEAEFHEKYHDDVMEEFGEDNRPTQEAYEKAQQEAKGTVSNMLARFEGDGDESRRDVMKKMGAGTAAVGLGAWATVDDGNQEALAAAEEPDEDVGPGTGEGIQWGMSIDLEQCDGCLSCVAACSEENNLDQGVNWMYVLDYEDAGAPSDSSRNRLVRPCQHCTDAPCEKVCPTTARHTRDQDGLVLTDYDVCIGCRYCQVACPYGVNYFQWGEPEVSTEAIADEHGVEPGEQGDHMTSEDDRWVDSRAPRGTMSKCTMCPSRQDGHMGDDMVGTTACEQACPPGAIQFGNMNDPSSDPQTYANNPSRSRALTDVEGALPSGEEIEDALEGADDDLESVLDALEDINEDDLAALIAIYVTAEEEMGEGDGDLAETEQEVLEVLEAIEAHGLGLAGEDVLVELGLADEPDEDEEFDGVSESDAQALLDQETGEPESRFRLLEDVGTNPNIIYLGNEPGPNAEQVDGPVAYEDIGQTDNRKEVLDEETVGDLGVSL